ncbi:MAG: ATP-dependent zinc metalloprotease FtsH [Candidatus Sumerlaeia bacterium]
MSRNVRNLTLWIAIFLAFILVAKMLTARNEPEPVTLSQLMKIGEEGRIKGKVTDQGSVLKGEYIENGETKTFETQYIGAQARDILAWTMENDIQYEAKQSNEMLGTILIQVLLPVIVLVVLWLFLMRQFQSGSNKAMSFGKSKAKLVTEGQVKVSFDDVAGIDEVKEELMEIIQFLKDPEKFSRLGGKIPKGALLYGPPGTGKTLIARAVSGEANVPFFSISGSDFVEMFVGVGASRVRDLFEQGKKAKPCLIYIDEIDAVGRHRFTGIGGGHDEREQTLNQLLVELDGFAANEGVIVMASTNRPDVLDPALLRPGRFDRQISVGLPDLKGREKILEVHTKALQLGDDVDLKQIARGTPGFSGADLANLANEAALLAARQDKEKVTMEDLEEAKDRVMMGPERRSMVMSEKEKTMTAYHEAGHAIVSRMTDNEDTRVHKVTIIPRGRTLGATAILPQEDVHSHTKKQLWKILLNLMGGRAAEQVIFDEMTTGAANDLHRATDIAHRMICDYGMNDKIGPRTCGDSSGGQVFLGKDIGHERDYSEATASLIDTEVHDMLQRAYDETQTLLTDNREILDRVSKALLERESLSGDELDKLIEGEELAPLFKEGQDSGDSDGSGQADDKKEEAGEEEKSGNGKTIFQDPSTQPS